jgi:hypothetical protein
MIEKAACFQPRSAMGWPQRRRKPIQIVQTVQAGKALTEEDRKR